MKKIFFIKFLTSHERIKKKERRSAEPVRSSATSRRSVVTNSYTATRPGESRGLGLVEPAGKLLLLVNACRANVRLYIPSQKFFFPYSRMEINGLINW